MFLMEFCLLPQTLTYIGRIVNYLKHKRLHYKNLNSYKIRWDFGRIISILEYNESYHRTHKHIKILEYAIEQVFVNP